MSTEQEKKSPVESQSAFAASSQKPKVLTDEDPSFVENNPAQSTQDIYEWNDPLGFK